MQAAAVFSQNANTAYVPVFVTAESNRAVTASIKMHSPDGSERTYTLEIGKQDTLAVPLRGFASVSYRPQKQANVPAAVYHNRGKLSLQLNQQKFQNAKISLLSVNGKRIWSANASASKDALKVSQPNTAAGVYLLSVKDVNGSSFETKITHCGGKLNINVAFGGEDFSPLRKNTNYANAESWTITASAAGHDNTSHEFTPIAGINPAQAITLHPTLTTTINRIPALIEKAQWGLVENNCSREVATANSTALQTAIDSLTRRYGPRIRLERGNYCLWGVDDGHNSKIVRIPSNTELDLNGSTLQLATNDEPWTALFRIERAENIRLFNGTLIGDRETHNYGRLTGNRANFARTKEWSSHEWGFGIRVRGGKNIEFYNLTIREVTGDCIIFLDDKSSNVTIRNNKLSRARRGGIVATNIDTLIIHDNYIFDIYNDVLHRDENNQIISIGAEACIAFEADRDDGREKISNVRIHNNLLDGRSSSNKLFFNAHYGTENIVISGNVIYGTFGLRFGNNILFKSNKVYDGSFDAAGTVNRNVSARNSTNVIIEDNEFYNYNIGSTGGTPTTINPDYKQNYVFIGNRFYDCGMTMVSNTNMAIIDNEFIVRSGRRGDIGIWIHVETPPSAGVTHQWYFADNIMTPGFANPKRYHLAFMEGFVAFTLQMNEAPNRQLSVQRNLPAWFNESNSREAAIAFINSFIWY